MTGIRKYHGKEFKLKVVMAALSGEKNLSQLASEYGVHTTQIKEWKAQALEAMGHYRVGVLLAMSLADMLEPAGRPKRWRFVPALPRRHMGKRDDAALRALFAGTSS